MQKLIYTQSLVKDIEKEETCPERFRGQWVDKEFKSEPNTHMIAGLYFEQLALGRSAQEDHNGIEFPRLKNGEKSTKQVRIEQQAQRFKELFDPKHKDFLGFTIISDQDYIEVNSRAGTLDFLATDRDNNICIFDLKLTATLQWSGSWWHDIAKVDLFQQYHYHKLYEDKCDPEYKIQFPNEKLRNLLIIFDYTPNCNVVVYELYPDENTGNNVDERFNAAEKTVGLYLKHGWITIPSVNECAKCPLDCKFRIKEG